MLRRGIPTWGWFVIILMTVYLVYNPTGISIYHLWDGENDRRAWLEPSRTDLPLRLLLTTIIIVAIGLYVWGSWRAIGARGFIILGILIGLSLWLLSSLGMFDPKKVGVWAWATQPMIALILTLGFRWPKIWRSATGTFTVDDPDTGERRH